MRLGTGPADRSSAEAAIAATYESAGLPPPMQVIWAGGPVEMTSRRMAAGDEDCGRNVKTDLLDGVRSRAVAGVEAATSAMVRSTVFHGLRSPVAEQAGIAVNTLVHEAAASVRPRLGQRLRRRLSRLRRITTMFEDDWRLYASGFGTHDLGWLASHQFLREVCGITTETAGLEGLSTLAPQVGWVLPYEKVCWVSERPTRLEVDLQGRLHSKDAAALQFADGWAVHAWKGIRVSPWMIEHPDWISARLINRERDPRVRRCLIEILTPARFIALGEAVPVARDETGILWRRHWPRQVWAAVEVVNGTPELDGTRKRYFLQVPPEMRSAREAVAWTYGMSEQQYMVLSIRT